MMLTTFTDKKTDKSIVMIVQSLPPLASGGAEIQALRLAEVLMRKGIKIMFITPGVGKIKGHTAINGVPVYRLHSGLNYLIDFLFSIKQKANLEKTVIEYDDSVAHNTINRKIGVGARFRYLVFLLNAYLFLNKRRSSVSMLHSHTVEWPGYVAALLSKWLKLRLIVKDSTMNGIYNILRFPSGYKKQQLIIRQAQFVAMTKMIRDNLLAAGVQPEKIATIPNGINISNSYKVEFSSSINVLFVGNLYQQPAKGVDILLKAWREVINSHPKAILHVAGDGDLAAYKKYTRAKGIEDSVNFHGKHDDVPSLMLQSDVFVLPSRREGMPNVLMEAMVRALPCVATDISGSQDLLGGGSCGILVPSADISELARAIIYLLSHREEAAIMGTNARKRIIASYNIDDVAEHYINLYHQ